MKVKSESEVAQLCLTPSNPMECSLPGSSQSHKHPDLYYIDSLNISKTDTWGLSNPSFSPQPPGKYLNRTLAFLTFIFRDYQYSQ